MEIVQGQSVSKEVRIAGVGRIVVNDRLVTSWTKNWVKMAQLNILFIHWHYAFYWNLLTDSNIRV